MNLPHYNYFSRNTFRDYVFFSEGPKGRIRKVVSFVKIGESPDVYNLALGDEDPQTGIVDDSVITDNKDRDIVLATVANIIHDFCDYYGNQRIYFTGSTATRTRLYQISISSFLDVLSAEFEIYGSLRNRLFDFQKNVNYDSFLIKRK